MALYKEIRPCLDQLGPNALGEHLHVSMICSVTTEMNVWRREYMNCLVGGHYSQLHLFITSNIFAFCMDTFLPC